MDESQRQEYLKRYRETRQRVVKYGFSSVCAGFFLLGLSIFLFSKKYLEASLAYLLPVFGLVLFIYGIFYILRNYHCPRCGTVPMDQMTAGKTGLVLNPSHCLHCGLSFEEGIEDLQQEGADPFSPGVMGEHKPERPRTLFILAALLAIGIVFLNLWNERKPSFVSSESPLISSAESVLLKSSKPPLSESFDKTSFQIEEQIIRQLGIFTASRATYGKNKQGESQIVKIDLRIYLTPEMRNNFLKEGPVVERTASYQALKNQVLGYFRRVYPSPVEYAAQAVQAPVDAEIMKKKRQAYFDSHLKG